ncbi:MFS transporter [Chenggangzhangella methanolivorans]|uniref:MFS transporter n=1 Tax=Chenggangzhangella methanolivorans TaxID=1437009 RepID=A0A9E6RF98_9HYPH|nr:MFS transporter [Chenggangzhangella methanolivorans]QZN99886.1 MFS transporter [Chenggangzhangella methanolivorans]
MSQTPAARPAAATSLPLIIFCGCAIACLTFGPRATAGLLLTPISETNGWGRDVFALSFAIQNLLWGVGQPFAGGFADRYGARPVLIVGGLLYAAGLALMPLSSAPGAMHLSAGVLIGFALSGASFSIVIGAFGKLLPAEWRTLGFGFGTAAGSFGQFLFTPLASTLVGAYGWQTTVLIFAGLMLLVLPLSIPLATRPVADASVTVRDQTIGEALREAFATPSYWLLVIGFFTCGFHLAFITAHLPPFLIDQGISPQVGGWALALIGLFNIAGSLSSGVLSGRMPKRHILAAIYFARAILIAGFIALPVTPTTALIFGAGIGLLWLSTIPPTSGLVATMFGTRYMTMLYGVVFLSHQIGSFMGVWLGGELYEAYGNYDLIWKIAIALSIMSALVNLPIRERAVERPATA